MALYDDRFDGNTDLPEPLGIDDARLQRVSIGSHHPISGVTAAHCKDKIVDAGDPDMYTLHTINHIESALPRTGRPPANIVVTGILGSTSRTGRKIDPTRRR
jgi:hypothetical protein